MKNKFKKFCTKSFLPSKNIINGGVDVGKSIKYVGLGVTFTASCSLFQNGFADGDSPNVNDGLTV